MSRREPIAGGSWLLDTPDSPPALWGDGDQVLWAAGEPLLICAPTGVGKTTITQQLVFARLGALEPSLLGLPVAVDHRRVVYVAADRPAQAARSGRRMIDERHRDLLDDRLIIWQGPLPFRIQSDPPALMDWLVDLGAGTVVIDSLKDVAVGLAEDAVGAAVNQALQHVVAAGIEPVALHHQRKSQDGRKPRALDDVYGSTWLTAGAGSVVLLWGDPGDPVVELTHLKQPAAEVGPLTVHHDHDRGRSTVPGPVDLLDVAARGVTATEAAQRIYDTSSPNRNQVERARRRLEKLADLGQVTREKAQDVTTPVTYWLASVNARDPQRERITHPITPVHDLAPQAVTHPITPVHAALPGTTTPPLKGGVDPQRDRRNGNNGRSAIYGFDPDPGETAAHTRPRGKPADGTVTDDQLDVFDALDALDEQQREREGAA